MQGVGTVLGTLRSVIYVKAGRRSSALRELTFRMQSYADLHTLIKKQIDEGRLLCDRARGTPSLQIKAWIKVSKKCLILMENRVPTLLRGFAGLNFHVEIPDQDVVPDELGEGNRVTLVQKVDEHRWSRSRFRDRRGKAFDFDFRALQRVVDLLELADEKLQIDSAPPGPMLLAEEPGARDTQEMTADKPALPNVGSSALAEAELVAKGPNLGAHRWAKLKPTLDHLGYSKSKWATKAGVDPSVVYGYMAGTSNPNAESRKVLAEAIGLPVDQLPK